MRWRSIHEHDLPECLQVQPLHAGDELVGRKVALHCWSNLLRSLSFNSAAVECAVAHGPRRIVGFGASVFVTPRFAAAELAAPRPFLNSRLFASMVSGEPVVRRQTDLCARGAAEGVDLLILFGNLQPAALRPEELDRAGMLLAQSFAELHVGYSLNRILAETVNDLQRAFYRSSGVWRTVEEFPDGRTLQVMTREDAHAVGGSIAGSLFHYEEPELGLRESEKELLAAALDGGTDPDLAKRLHVSIACVKKRWQSVFARVAERSPELLPDQCAVLGRETRGLQKRYHVLSYVRSHPSELRPYRWRA